MKADFRRSLYTNYLSSEYADQTRLQNVEREYMNLHFWNVRYVWPHLQKKRGGNHLDIGCGLGQNLFSFRRMGFESVGVDISSECVDFCKAQGFNVEKEDAQTYLTGRDSVYDVITMYHVLEHLDPESAVSLIRVILRALVPGGSLIINTPNGADSVGGIAARYVDLTHVLLYTPKSLRQLLLQAGVAAADLVIREEVAYAPDDVMFWRRLVKKTLLPIMTLMTDLVSHIRHPFSVISWGIIGVH